ncbi:MAG: hypothetical protein EKK29_21885 [Hyphomicrobiales bacterium]|nr:MAG: hypothetical protein EKK29_21885 [Hyphomicrobiales bacterium]
MADTEPTLLDRLSIAISQSRALVLAHRGLEMGADDRSAIELLTDNLLATLEAMHDELVDARGGERRSP